MWYGTSNRLVKGMSKELVMKYTKLTIICALMVHTTITPLDDYTNQTFMFVRPIFDSVGIQQSSWHDIAFRKQKTGSAVQIYPIYEQSFENLNNPGYFLFNHRNIITITPGTPSTFTLPSTGALIVNNPMEGELNVPSFNRDVLGQWVGINTTSTDPNNVESFSLTLNPHQRQACVVVEFSQDLNKVYEWDMFSNWFLNVSLPLTWIESNIGVTGNQEALDAFNNPSFGYLRIAPGDNNSFRLTQASVSLGTRYMGEPDTHVITTSGLIIPLVEQDCNATLFEPVQGFNAHFGIDTNVFFQFPILQTHEYSNSKILFFLDIHNNFLARNHQLRTYDIRGKPFSRYMKLLDRATNTLIPAMNALTIRSRVEPFMITNFATGFRMKYKDSFGEIGYELWAHGSEVVTPEQKPDVFTGPGLWCNDRYGIPFINTDGVLATVNATTGNVEPLALGQLGQTASNSTINFVAPPDGSISCCSVPPTFIPKNKYIRLVDLDHVSCASRTTITHRAFASVGFGDKGRKRDCFANFGLFIEASQNNAALCFWGGWFKAGLTF